MYRTFTYLIILQFFTVSLFGQYPPCCKPVLEKGQIILVRTEMNNNSFQTAGAQVINFKVNGTAIHRYTVTNVTSDQTTLHHEMLEILFSFEGMGQKKNFDSKNEEDMKGPFGAYFKDLLSRVYDIIIDTNGQTRSWSAYADPTPKPDDNIITIIDMLKPLTQLASLSSVPATSTSPLPNNGFFSILPVDPFPHSPELKYVPSKTWEYSVDGENEKSKTIYTLISFTDSTILVDFLRIGTTHFKSERMGRITSTNLNIEEKGKIIADRKTGILKELTSTTDSNGTTEAMGGTVPVNGKISLITSVSFLDPKESR